MQTVLVWIMVLMAVAVSGTVKRLPIEHCYCDPMTPAERQSTTTTAPPLSVKGVCRGETCPSLDVRSSHDAHRVVSVHIEGSRWTSVNGVDVYVEETSGWYLLYRDAALREPLRPSEEELASDNTGGEIGYHKGPQRCGYLMYGG